MIPSWLTARFLFVLLLATLVALVGGVLATDYDWVNGSGAWDDTDNWDPDTGYPGDSVTPTDTAKIRDQNGITIDLIDVTIAELLLRLEITFTSQSAAGNTVSVTGAVTVNALNNQDTDIFVTDYAAIDTAG